MAKKKKASKHVRIGSLRVPRPMIAAAMAALQSPVGKVILAEALIQAAALLTTRHPTAAATAAGAGTATAAKDAVGGASEAVAKFMHSAADLLKDGVEGRQRGNKHKKAREEEAPGTASHDAGNGADSRGEVLNRDAIREILIGELGRQKARKKAKHADRR